MPDAHAPEVHDAPEVHPDNTHYMFGIADTAHGGNGAAVERMAPHLFGEGARTPEPYQHLPHAIEYEYPEQAESARHTVSNEALAATEASRIANALAEAAAAAGEAGDAGTSDASVDGATESPDAAAKPSKTTVKKAASR